MLTRRIIPCLDVRNGRVVKGVNFEGLRDVDDPVALARFYNDSGADELVFYDITASAEGRPLFADALSAVAAEVFIPLTVGGSINTLDDFDRVLKCGADKVSVNSGAIRDPSLIARAAKRYGDQCVVLSMDVKRVDGRFHVFARGGRDDTGWMPLTGSGAAWTAARARSWSTPSTPTACAGALMWKCSGPWARRYPCPSSHRAVAGCREDFLDVFRLDCVDAGLAASIFHSREVDIRASSAGSMKTAYPCALWRIDKWIMKRWFPASNLMKRASSP